ncbi:site-specific DNA-methyltransferase [Serratia marcescens]|nr:site-specific DNA-methyltransferase [Serratia marcescens]
MKNIVENQCIKTDKPLPMSYEALKAERDAQQKRADELAVENENQRDWINKCSELWDAGCDLDNLLGLIPETPATDAALAAIEARGVEKLIKLKMEQLANMHPDTHAFGATAESLRAHENILVFYRGMPTYNPQFTEGHPRKTSRRKTVNSEVYGEALTLTEYDSTRRYPRDVQFFSSDKQKGRYHPTQKPVGLVRYLIETYSNPGDVVLDFTMGSGTAGVACSATGRRFIGIEKEQKYVEVARRRIFGDSAREVERG